MDRLLSGAVLALAAVSIAADPLIKSTACGPVEGLWQTVSTTERVAAWKGIPYATPPVGALRWRPPTAPTCWRGTFNASQFGNVCYQYGMGSEDCLSLNVFVPEAVANGSVPSAPVFAYIHGGGLTGGSSAFEQVAALSAHAQTGVSGGGAVVVTFNYRLNIFGWLTTEELTADGGGHNFGLQDMQLALQWIQTNIKAFGGDPARVTLGGQSSGGTAIFALMSSPASRGLFSGAIALSGSINISMGLPQAYAQNAPIVTALGCAGEATPAARVACMRALTPAQLSAGIPSSWGTPGIWGLELLSPSGMGFAGLPVVDGASITHSFEEALAIGLVDVPLIFGNMGQENDLAPDQDVSGYTQQQWQALLNATMAPWNITSMGGRMYDAYQAQSLINPALGYDDINTDYGLTCGSVDIAVGAAAGGRGRTQPIYLYVNQWAPSTPIPTGPAGSGSRPLRWAYHTWDWLAACESFQGQTWGWAPQTADWDLARLLQGIWGEFMATGRVSAERWNWLPVDGAHGFPAHYSTFVMSANTSSTFVDYKVDTCALLTGYGFDSRFWWCN